MRQEKEIDLPDWLDPEVWFDWVDHRKKIKKPMTKRAKELSIMRLDKLRQYEDPRFIVDRSLDGGWQKLYPPKIHETKARSRDFTPSGSTPSGYRRDGESWEDFQERTR